MIYLFAFAYIMCSILAFYLFCNRWLNDFKVMTIGDAIIPAFLSLLGPISVTIALLITGMDALSKTKFMKKVLWQRK